MPMVTMPPTSTDGTEPMAPAIMPARKSPSSFEALMATELTALTRPRMPSGVAICTRVWRM